MALVGRTGANTTCNYVLNEDRRGDDAAITCGSDVFAVRQPFLIEIIIVQLTWVVPPRYWWRANISYNIMPPKTYFHIFNYQ